MCELGLQISSTKAAIRLAFDARISAGAGYFDIQPIQLLLVYSVSEETGTNKIIGIFTFEAVCSLEVAHRMNIEHDELTWPSRLQQELQKDHQAKSRVVQEGEGRKPRPLQTRAIMLGRLEKLNDKKHMTPSSAHRDGGPFSISLECLAAQGIHFEMGTLRVVV